MLRLFSLLAPMSWLLLARPALARPAPLPADPDLAADFFTLLGILAFIVLLAGQVCCIVASLTGCSRASLARCTALFRPRGPSLDDLARQQENQAYLELDSDEQELFFQSQDYLAAHPYLRGPLSSHQLVTLAEKGVLAYEFLKDPMLSSNDLIIVAKTELNFFKPLECGAVTNLPMPGANDVYYFEAKIYSLPHPLHTIILVGLAAKPYPWFRLPGRHQHSVAYDLDGHRRHHQPFKFAGPPPFPPMREGDVVGVGYRTGLGTVFFTHNGKKISELRIGGHIKHFAPPHHGQLFPTIGANNLCSVHVNLGQRGFVWIEANVKKYGYAPIEGTGPAPPAYNKFNADILLECADNDVDQAHGLSPHNTAAADRALPPDFWLVHRAPPPLGAVAPPHSLPDHDKFSYNAYSDAGSCDERITLASIAPPRRPPSYSSGSGDDAEAPAGLAGLVGLVELAGLVEELEEPDEPDELFASALSGILALSHELNAGIENDSLDGGSLDDASLDDASLDDASLDDDSLNGSLTNASASTILEGELDQASDTEHHTASSSA